MGLSGMAVETHCVRALEAMILAEVPPGPPCAAMLGGNIGLGRHVLPAGIRCRQRFDFSNLERGLSGGGGCCVLAAGGGIAFVVNSRINVDAGVALVRQSFGDFELTRSGSSGTASFEPFTTYAAKIGISIGFPK